MTPKETSTSIENKHFNDKFLIGLVTGLVLAILFLGIVLGGYWATGGYQSTTVDNNVSKNTTTKTTAVITTTLSTTVITATSTATVPSIYTLTIDKNLAFDKSTLTIHTGDTVKIVNNSGRSLGGATDPIYVTLDKSLAMNPSVATDTKVGIISNGSSYSFTYTSPSAGTRLLKSKGACQAANDCTSSQVTITIIP